MGFTNAFWILHGLFYDPPGTPPKLRCVSCRYTAAGAAGAVGLVGVYGVAKTMPSNVFRGMSCVFLAVLGFGCSGVAIKMARQDKHWNETRYLEYQTEVKARRKENREQMNHAA